ncbi:hypothetical protein [Tabrizicola sp. M-4]|uniref:hypothetical protein n=1 Tax=Tabrizicola sp. M-4 TaxID=3055847 RepID=UPI003DAA0513
MDEVADPIDAPPPPDQALPLPQPPKRKRRPRATAPCRRCLNIRWFLLAAGPLLIFGLVSPVAANSLLSNLPDLRQLVLWFPLVIVGTFLYRYLTWRRQSGR